MLIEGDANGCASEVLVIVAALSIQDVRERPLEHQQAADSAHARFTDPHSDFITYLNLWRYLNTQARDLSGSAFRRMCRGEFLHYLRFREWRDVVNQLRQMARPLDLVLHPIGEPSSADVARAAASGGIANATARAVVAFTDSANTVDADDIHRSLLVGLLSNLGNWDVAARTYVGARGTRFTIWPGSGLSRAHPEWVMTAELVETSRLFARTVARIDPAWIEPAARDLVTRVYSEPYWSSAQGAAMVKEKVLLYGLTLVADRSVLLGRLGDDIAFGDGAGSGRSGVAAPGTLAGIAQGLLGAGSRSGGAGRGRAEHELSGTTAIADALADALTQSGEARPSGPSKSAPPDHRDPPLRTTEIRPSGPAETHAPIGGDDNAAPRSDAGGGQPPDGASTDGRPAGARDDDAAAVTDSPGRATPAPPVDERQSPPSGPPSSADDGTITAHELAREMFIRHALVGGEWRERPPFQRTNEERLEQAREVERRSRRGGLVAGEDALFAFFDDLLPDDIVSAGHFNGWWKRARREAPDLLVYPPSLLLPRGTGADAGAFPDHWVPGRAVGERRPADVGAAAATGGSGEELRLPLAYEFAPGSPRDGVSVRIPIEVLPRLRPEGADWLVPGMWEELATGWIRALPKARRRLLAPAPEVAAQAVGWIRAHIVGTGSTAIDEGGPRGGAPESGAVGSTSLPRDSRAVQTEGGVPVERRGTHPGEAEVPANTADDPRSLDAAMARLARWGQNSGRVVRAPSRATASGPAASGPAASGPPGRRGSPDDPEAQSSGPARSAAGGRGPSSDAATVPSPGTGAATTGGGAPVPWPPFAQVLARAVADLRGVDLSADDLRHAEDNLPDHLRMTFVVVDRHGAELGAGKDLVHLQRTLASAADKAVRTAVRGAVAEAFADATRRRGSSSSTPRKHRGGTDTGRGAGTASPPSRNGAPAEGASSSPDGRPADERAAGVDRAGNTDGHSASRAPSTAGATDASRGVRVDAINQTGTAAASRGAPGSPAGPVPVLDADGLTAFPQVSLPRSIQSRDPATGLALRGFPALVPQGTAAAPAAGVRLQTNPAEADRLHREGLARLLLLRVRLATTRVTTRWTGREALMLAASPYDGTAALVDDAQLASALSLVDDLTAPAIPRGGPSSVRSAEAFEQVAARARDLHEDRVHEILGHVVRAMEALSEVQGAIRAHPEASLQTAVRDVDRTARALVHPGFLADTPAVALPHLARYLRAGAARIERAAGGAAALRRDDDAMRTVRQVEQAVDDAAERAAARPYDAARAATLERARWMVQELRVSLFAQQLGTPQKVSAKRVLGLLGQEGR